MLLLRLTDTVNALLLGWWHRENNRRDTVGTKVADLFYEAEGMHASDHATRWRFGSLKLPTPYRGAAVSSISQFALNLLQALALGLRNEKVGKGQGGHAEGRIEREEVGDPSPRVERIELLLDGR